MKNNIFEGAKFGDKFLTRGGEIAIYHIFNALNDRHYLINPKYSEELPYRNDGTCSLNVLGTFNHDIVSRYQETIDEDKLDELAQEHCLNNGYYGCCEDEYIEDHSTTYGDIMNDIEKAYKAGYHKAKEE